MSEFKNKLSKEIFGKSFNECVAEGICVTCHGPAKSFSDSLSIKEYKISGMCQKCQDEVFSEPVDEGDYYDCEYDGM